VLLRVVADNGAGGGTVVPDPRRCRPGRGAWVHPDPDCVAAAQRRRSFGRALRVAGPIDTSAVEEYLSRDGAARHPDAQPSGSPQEMKINGNSMKRQR